MSVRSTLIACVITTGLLCGNVSQGWAQRGELLPVAQLSSIFPAGAQVGTTTEITCFGQHLEGPNVLHFADEGIKSRVKLDDQGQPIANTFVIEVSPEVQPGVYDVRLQGTFGLSNPRQFVVGTLPEAMHARPSIDQTSPIRIPMDTTINTETVPGNYAWFQIALRDSQQVFLHLDAPDSRAEPIVTVYHPDGVVAMRGRLPKKDFEFMAGQAGDYNIQVHDLLFRGGEEFRFRLTVTSQPIDSAAYYSLAQVDLPQDALRRIEPWLSSHKTNNASTESASVAALEVSVPFQHTDRFPANGQPQRFLFPANAKDVFWIEVFSHRLGLATDAEIVVERIARQSDGQESYVLVGQAPDIEYTASAAGFELDSLDGLLRFEVPEDGLYRISLRDAFNTQEHSPRLPYHLIVRRATPDFKLIAVPDQGPRNRPIPISATHLSPTLRRGGVTSLRVFVQRKDGFDADIHLAAEGLPDGVTCMGAILGPGDECASLTFYASDDARPWAGKIRVEGRTALDGGELVRTASAVTPIWNVKDTRQDLFRARTTDAIGLAVIAEQAPVLLEPITETLAARVHEKIGIKFKVVKRGGYDQIINVRPFVLGDQAKSVLSDHVIPPSATEVTFELDLNKFDVQPGEHSFVFHGFADKVSYVKTLADGKADKPKEMSFALFSKPIRINILADNETK